MSELSAIHPQHPRIGRYLVVGSINMDTILSTQRAPSNDGAVLVTNTARLPGGHAANCASALAALGADVALVGAVGDDNYGQALIDDLEQRGIDSRYVQRLTEHLTGEVIIPTFADEHFMLVQRNANDHATIDLADAVAHYRPDALVVFDPSRHLFRQIEDLRRSDRHRLATYWIPGGINAGDPWFTFMFDISDTIIVNATERLALETLAPGQLAYAEHRELVTTLGSKGSRLQQGALDLFVPADAAQVEDSVGAGDAFAAAYIIARQAALPAHDRLEVANVAGAIAVRSAGARVTAREFASFWSEPRVAQAFMSPAALAVGSHQHE